MRVGATLTGVLLVFTSVWCFAHSGATYLSLAFLLGVMMLLQGTSLFTSFLIIKKTRKIGPSWLLGDGITTIILALPVLFNMLTADVVVPVFFGLWILSSGIFRIVSGINEKWLGDFKWLIFFGSISSLVGAYLLINQSVFDIPIILLLSLVFLLQGINMLYFSASQESAG